MECEFCQRILSTKSNLKAHQKSKFCLQKQNKDFEINAHHVCAYCDKKISSKQMLKVHMKNCSANSDRVKQLIEQVKTLTDEKTQLMLEKETEIATLKGKLEVYKQMSEFSTRCLEEIAKQPKVSNTQNIQNNKLLNMTPFDIEDQEVKDKVGVIANEFFSEEYFNCGQKGIARFTVEKILKDIKGQLQYVCTDNSRQVFKYKSNGGDIRTDLKAKQLSKMIYETVITATKSMMSELLEKTPGSDTDGVTNLANNFMAVKELDDGDNTEFRTELATLTGNK